MKLPLSETEANRQITEAYLELNSFTITLVRLVKVEKPSGGYGTVPESLQPQGFAIIGPQAGIRRAPEITANLGSVSSYNLTLLGRYDADVQDSDEFILDGGKYRVDFVFPDRSFRTASVIVYEGQVGA